MKRTIEDVDKKTPNISGLVKNVDFNTKNTEIENKICNFTELVTTDARNTKATETGNN